MKILFVGLAVIIALGSCVEQRIQTPEENELTVRESSLPGKDGGWLVESRITPQALERRESFMQQCVAHNRRVIQGANARAELHLDFYYKRLDRSRTNYTGIRTGYWPEGHYDHTSRIEGAELAEMQRILAQMEAVPLAGRPLRFVRRNPNRSSKAHRDIGYSSLQFLLASDQGMLRLDPKEQLVKSSQVPTVMKQLSMRDFCYYLPDAEYEAFMALPSIRKIYAMQEKYQEHPADFFISSEEMFNRKTAETLREQLPQAEVIQLRLYMHYPRLAQGKKPALLVPHIVPCYVGQVKVGEAERARLADIFSRLQTVPMRYLVPFTAAPRRTDGSEPTLHKLNLRVKTKQGPQIAIDIIHSIIRASEIKTAASQKYGDCVRWALPDADYDALMALPSVCQLIEWSSRYKDAPADFFVPDEE